MVNEHVVMITTLIGMLHPPFWCPLQKCVLPSDVHTFEFFVLVPVHVEDDLHRDIDQKTFGTSRRW